MIPKDSYLEKHKVIILFLKKYMKDCRDTLNIEIEIDIDE